jgi:uncharacterized protein (TIGR03083 family)
VDKQSYLSSVRQNGEAFATTARRGLDPPVPSCPGWTVRDLVVHLGGVYTFWSSVAEPPLRSEDEVREMRSRLQAERERQAKDPAFREIEPLLSWFHATVDRLEAALSRLGPSEQVWTWSRPDQTAGFIQRRMAQETAVHRWDMELAHDCTQPLEAALARDGIDEMLDVFLPETVAESKVRGEGESYHFHRTDGEGEWLVRFDRSGPAVSREHGKAGIAIRGPASDLLLFLWHRIPADRLEVICDRSLIDRYFELVPPE